VTGDYGFIGFVDSVKFVNSGKEICQSGDVAQYMQERKGSAKKNKNKGELEEK